MKYEFKKFLKEFNNGTKTMFKEFFNKETNKKQRANMWTFSRLITSLLIPICSLISILTANFSLFICSIGITGFGALTDFFDGRSARKHNSFSEYGRLLDQIADKIFALMIGINLALFNPIFLVTLLGEASIVAVNIPYKLKYENLKIKSTLMGRIKQWPLFSSLILGFLSTILPSLNTITYISILITFIFQLATMDSYFMANNKQISELRNTDDNKLEELQDDFEKDKHKTKEITRNNNIIQNNNHYSRSEQCQKLKEIRDEIINKKTNINTIEENNYQKIKK